jgi:hypothetical protein
LLAGGLWQHFGAAATFYGGAVITLVALIGFIWMKQETVPRNQPSV